MYGCQTATKDKERFDETIHHTIKVLLDLITLEEKIGQNRQVLHLRDISHTNLTRKLIGSFAPTGGPLQGIYEGYPMLYSLSVNRNKNR